MAFEIVSSRPNLSDAKSSAIKKLNIEDEVRFAQLKTRINSLNGIEADFESSQLKFESSLSRALVEGIEKPTIKVDVVGVIILSNTAIPIPH